MRKWDLKTQDGETLPLVFNEHAIEAYRLHRDPADPDREHRDELSLELELAVLLANRRHAAEHGEAEPIDVWAERCSPDKVVTMLTGVRFVVRLKSDEPLLEVIDVLPPLAD